MTCLGPKTLRHRANRVPSGRFDRTELLLLLVRFLVPGLVGGGGRVVALVARPLLVLYHHFFGKVYY